MSRPPVDALHAFRLGQKVNEVRNDEWRFGEGAVPEMGRLMKISTSVLYNYGKVASRLTEEEFKAELARPCKNGQQLTITHFVRASHGGSKEAMLSLLEAAREGNLGTMELQGVMALRRRSGKGKKSTSTLSFFAHRILAMGQVEEFIKVLVESGVKARDIVSMATKLLD